MDRYRTIRAGRWARWSDSFYDRVSHRLTPGLRNSQYAYLESLRPLAERARAWLDLGCGHDIVPDWVNQHADDLKPQAGIDPDLAALRRNKRIQWRVAAYGERLPFADERFDLVTANMVLEHVSEPGVFLREIARVLSPGGRVLIHTPNAVGYSTLLARLVPQALRARLAGSLHDRDVADVYRTYYRANTAPTIRQLSARAGFARCEITFVNSSPQLIRIPPLLLPELLLIRAVSLSSLRRLRSCLVIVLERGPASDG